MYERRRSNGPRKTVTQRMLRLLDMQAKDRWQAERRKVRQRNHGRERIRHQRDPSTANDSLGGYLEGSTGAKLTGYGGNGHLNIAVNGAASVAHYGYSPHHINVRQ